MHLKRVLLFCPPGGRWLRGEARCEQDLDQATAYTVTAPTTLAYMAAIFREAGIDVKIMDCPVEEIGDEAFLARFREFSPDLAILNASVLNLKDDAEWVTRVKKIHPASLHAMVVPYFKLLSPEEIPVSLLRQVDLLIIGEMEAVTYDLTGFVVGTRPLQEVRGIMMNLREEQRFQATPPVPPLENLDALPFPARDLIRNDLYLRPDVGRPMAAIVDGRGCPSACIFCLAPVTTGRRPRKRSVDSVVREIAECIDRYGIRDFLFRSDAFTIDREWVFRFCREIRQRSLVISWAANSKTISFDESLGRAMKEAGCFLVEFGIESGDDDSLKRMKKGGTVEQARQAVRSARRAGLLTYGTFLVGFPWENGHHLMNTARFIRSSDLDFIEIQVVAPYRGTELFHLMRREGLIDGDTIGHDMVQNPACKGTRTISVEQLLEFRRRELRRFYFRPRSIARKLWGITSWRQFQQYARHGLRLLWLLCRGMVGLGRHEPSPP